MELKQYGGNDSKILLMGLDNAGKTSILLSLKRNTNLMTFLRLNPTKGIEREKLKDLRSTLHVWDFGGQEQYRKLYLKDLDEYFEGARKLIYVIDVQDIDRYEASLEYFQQILDYIVKSSSSVEISVFLHKFDTDLEFTSTELIKENVPRLVKKIEEMIPENIKYQIFKTTIFTIFQKTSYL